MALLLAFGDFELDEARFELRRGGERVTLQPKVLELILYLARNRERVVGKEELFETIWDGTVVTDASLNRAVSHARKALGDSPTTEHAIRTVRGKGLQFVAAARTHDATVARRPPSIADVQRGTTEAGSTQLETAQDDAYRVSSAPDVPVLFAAIHGETPKLGGACWSLAEVDEVNIVRGSRRKTKRESGMTRVLTITIPGRLLSRNHARVVRTPDGWLVVDAGSRNGTFVNGEKVKKREIVVGDLIECGRTVFVFDTASSIHTDDSHVGRTLLTTVTPRLRALERELTRVAPSPLPVLLLGESGVGKSHLATALHELSGRTGGLAKIDACGKHDASRLAETMDAAFRTAAGGTVLVENLDRLGDDLADRLTSLIESAVGARIISTSSVPFAALQRSVPQDLLTRLSGYRCELPPLRERRGDLGMLLGAILERSAIEPAAALALLRHDWPGNLREFELVLRAAAVLAGGETLRVGHLPAELRT